jgi:hypothetical protein
VPFDQGDQVAAAVPVDQQVTFPVSRFTPVGGVAGRKLIGSRSGIRLRRPSTLTSVRAARYPPGGQLTSQLGGSTPLACTNNDV